MYRGSVLVFFFHTFVIQFSAGAGRSDKTFSHPWVPCDKSRGYDYLLFWYTYIHYIIELLHKCIICIISGGMFKTIPINMSRLFFLTEDEFLASASRTGIATCTVKPQSHRIVRFCDRTIGCELVSYDRSAMFAAISFYNRTLWCILYDWL